MLMPVGRPTIYNEELLKKAAAYVDGGYNVFPSIAGLAIELGVSRETIHTWVKDGDKPAFSDIIHKLQAMQEKELLEKGLMGTYNSTITKVVLTKHGYSDKQETEISGKDGKPIESVTEVRMTFVDSGTKNPESV